MLILNTFETNYHSSLGYTKEMALFQEVSRESSVSFEIAVLTALVPITLVFIFVFFFYYRRRRESDFRQRELELRVARAEMEMKALRSQVNPHFIFNCLNSIQHYIHNSDNELAEKYLVKFSRLIRQVLEHSSDAFVSLEDDLKTLELYIQLESIRMDDSFNYQINISSEIDPNRLFVPPMLLQPIIENSIWHGLNNRSNGGKIDINFTKAEGYLACQITDNGKKGNYVSNLNGKSFGMALIKERIHLLMELNDMDSILKMTSLEDETGTHIGMHVDLIIPYEEE